MLSKKMAFSLMSLITLLVFTFVAGDAFAAEKPFEIKIMGPTKATYATLTSAVTVDLMVESAQPIPALSAAAEGNVTVTVVDRRGFVDDATVTATDRAITDYPMRTAKKRQFRVSVTQEADTVDNTKGLIEKLIITIPAGLKTTDPTVMAAKDGDTKLDESKLVQHTITLSMAPTATQLTDIPKVVSIQRLRPGSQTVVAAFQEEVVTDFQFDVRFVLTEAHSEYDAGKNANENAGRLIEVENGEVRNLVVGTTFAQVRATAANADSVILPHPSEGMYEYGDDVAPTLGLPTLGGTPTDFVPGPTSDDNMYRQYRVTIRPHRRKGDPSKTFDVKIKVKNFHDGGSVVRNTYVSPGFGESANLPNGREILTVKVAYTEVDVEAGYRVTLPKDLRIPGGGYLVIVQNKAGSAVHVPPGSTKDEPKRSERTPAERLYNVHEAPTLPNLATAFPNGVVVDVESYDRELLITEVMWGEDTSLTTSSNSQYIELYNPGDSYLTIDDKPETPYLNEAVTLVFYGPNEFADIPIGGELQEAFLVDASGEVLRPAWWADSVFVERPDELPGYVSDRIGTLDIEGAYWSPAEKGQSGRSGTQVGELTTGRGPFEPPVPIISMYRVMTDGTPEDGQMESSWMSSEGPKSANFNPLAIGIRHGTPGAATDATRTPADDTADEEAEAAEKKAAEDKAAAEAEKTRTTGTIPEAGSIYISEIMFAGNGSLPQWIEIANGSATEDVNLSGWTLTIANAVADAEVSIGASATFTIPDGTMIDRSRQIESPSTILVVTETGRNNIDAVSDQVVNLKTDNEVELILAGVTKRKYTLLSDEAFLITLAPPTPEKSTPPAGETAAAKAKRMAAEKQEAAKRKEATDMAGNLGADGTAAWALPVSEGSARSSIIRRHVVVSIGPSEPNDGMEEENWILAKDTDFKEPTHVRQRTYYGAMSDEGTPGFRAGGALPVELSHFRPARDKATGAAVITWATESELNNAGFFIKRSQQRNGEFKVINATMVPGAGTTSEKQFYTYTDTTAQPNVVYYYQIEDVSLDGNRQTLTRGIRLKGHVGAAGKATVIWGELKTSHE